jgi:signal transduction histidine kinase
VILGAIALLGIVDYGAGFWFSLQFFYLIPILLSVAWLGWKEGCVTAVLCVLVRVTGDIATGIFEHVAPVAVLWNRLIDLLVCWLLVWIFHALTSLQRRLEQRIEERTAALQEAAKARRQLEHELLAVAARERNSVGHELHDDICQHLVGTALAAKVLAQHLIVTDRSAAAEAQAIVRLLEDGAAKTRQLARGLLLGAIEPEKLGEKLSELAIECESSGVPCRFQHKGNTLLPDAGTAAQVFRIAQEAVRNALRHAAPLHVDISLVGDAHAICLMVEDDGRGLPPAENRGSGMGLRIMSHRAAFIGGTLSLIPTADQGTRVICHLPRAQTVS